MADNNNNTSTEEKTVITEITEAVSSAEASPDAKNHKIYWNDLKGGKSAYNGDPADYIKWCIQLRENMINLTDYTTSYNKFEAYGGLDGRKKFKAEDPDNYNLFFSFDTACYVFGTLLPNDKTYGPYKGWIYQTGELLKNYADKLNLVFNEDNPGTGEYKRIKKEDQQTVIDTSKEILPSAQERIEAGVKTSSFEASTSSYLATTNMDELTAAAAQKNTLLSYQSTISNLRAERATEVINTTSNIVTSAIETAMVGVAGWEAIKSQFSKEGLQKLWTSIQDATFNEVKNYGISKVTQLTADAALLATDSVSYLATRTAYWTSYCTASLMNEINLSDLMTTEEIKLNLSTEADKLKKKAADLAATQGKFTNTIKKVNDKVNQVTDKIQIGISYAVEGPDIILNFLDTTMDYGMSEVDKYYNQGYNEAKEFLFGETDKLANTAGQWASDKVCLPIKKALQETMNQIYLLKAQAIIKASSAAAVAISKIAALVGL